MLNIINDIILLFKYMIIC